MKEVKPINLSVALIPVFFLIFILFFGIVVFDQSPHVPIIFAIAVASAVAVFHNHPWKEVQKGMVHGITLAMDAVLILIVVGTMIGTWILGGVVPTLIYYGLKLLSPGIFLVATLIICSIVSLGTGSSWATAGTIGVALIGVGKGLGVPAPMVAGAIISGSYFGDKMSPLSDTTNLAPAVAGTDIFTHIRHMVFTTGPSYIIAMIIYAFLGTQFTDGNMNTQNVTIMLQTLEQNFFIHPILILPPCLVILMVVKKVPPLPALFGGMVLGGICAIAAQSATIAEMIHAAFTGYASETGVPMVDNLLSRGGLMYMMDTIALVIVALSLGGILEKTGMLEIIALSLLKRVKRTGSLVATTVLSCIGMNAIASDQYLAIIIPGRMYKDAFNKRGLHPKNLSRCLEDSGTLTSALIPWNSGGAYMSATLGVGSLSYLPFAFLNLLNPLISIFYGYTGITMEKLESETSSESDK